MNPRAERETMQTLWDTSSRRLRSWFERRTKNSHDAEDLVQETFARVQARLGDLKDGERLYAWVGTIAANVLADHGRRQGWRTVPLEDVETGSGAAASSSCTDADIDLEAAVAGWLEAFLGRLDPDDAAILRAVDLEGRAQVDVARELGLAASSARSRVQRARLRLRKHLEACCSFAFDARGGLTDVTRNPGSACDCDGT